MGGDKLEPYFDENPWEKTKRQTQDFPTLSHPNGAVFVSETEAFVEAGDFYTNETIGYEMPRRRSLDIDDQFDLEVAQALYSWRGI